MTTRAALPNGIRWAGIGSLVGAVAYVATLGWHWYAQLVEPCPSYGDGMATAALAWTPGAVHIWLLLALAVWVVRRVRGVGPAKLDFGIWTACGVVVLAWYAVSSGLAAVPFKDCGIF